MLYAVYFRKDESDMIGAMTVAEDCDRWSMLAGFFGYLME